jgi:hypothetical protein
VVFAAMTIIVAVAGTRIPKIATGRAEKRIAVTMAMST